AEVWERWARATRVPAPPPTPGAREKAMRRVRPAPRQATQNPAREGPRQCGTRLPRRPAPHAAGPDLRRACGECGPPAPQPASAITAWLRRNLNQDAPEARPVHRPRRNRLGTSPGKVARAT